MRRESGFQIASNWSKIVKMTMASQFADMTSSSNFFDVDLFLFPSLVTAPSFMSISLLVLELWQFSCIRNWPEIQKLKIRPSEFCPTYEDWDDLGITNLAQMSLIRYFWMLKNAKFIAFTVSELPFTFPPFPSDLEFTIKYLCIFKISDLSIAL